MGHIYKIMKDDFELKFNLNYEPGDGYNDGLNCEPVEVKSFTTKDDALNALKDYRCSFYQFNSPKGNCMHTTEYWVEEFTDSHEYSESTGIWAFAELSDVAKNILNKSKARCQNEIGCAEES